MIYKAPKSEWTESGLSLSVVAPDRGGQIDDAIYSKGYATWRIILQQLHR